MGESDVRGVADEGQAREFTKAVLRDVQALEMLLERGLIETGKRRFGVEQEMFLVDERGAPAPVAEQVLSRIDDDRFTTELARFNLEANLPPGLLEGDFLDTIHEQVSDAVGVADETARSLGARILLIGILPTLRVSHLTVDNMSPVPRYLELNRSALRLKGGREFTIFIRGLEVFEESFDNLMAEAANTSLQLHYQVEPATFARDYNTAQLISARCSRRRRTHRCFAAGDSGTRRGSRCSSGPSTLVRRSRPPADRSRVFPSAMTGCGDPCWICIGRTSRGTGSC